MLYCGFTMVKVPLLWVMKGSYFGFGRHACKVKNTFIFYNMHLFLPYLLNDSQTIHSTIHFFKLLLCVTLLCSDWLISFKAEHSVTLCTALPTLTLQMWNLVAKNEFAFSFRPTRKSSFPRSVCATSGREIC